MTRFALIAVLIAIGVASTTAQVVLRPLHQFPDDGWYLNPLIEGRDGNLYGTSWIGGTFGDGYAFRVTPNGAFSVLHDFSSEIDGGAPSALVQGSDGFFYGVTTGNVAAPHYGTVFRMSTEGVVTALHIFAGGPSEGRYPKGPLVQGNDGLFYGTTFGGGAFGRGTVFKMTAQGETTIVHHFAAGAHDGAEPSNGLALGADGNFYGVTDGSGSPLHGTVFRMNPLGAVTVLRRIPLNVSEYGNLSMYRNPITKAPNGSLYGSTAAFGTYLPGGNIFRIAASGAIGTVYDFPQ